MPRLSSLQKHNSDRAQGNGYGQELLDALKCQSEGKGASNQYLVINGKFYL